MTEEELAKWLLPSSCKGGKLDDDVESSHARSHGLSEVALVPHTANSDTARCIEVPRTEYRVPCGFVWVVM